MLLDDIEEAKAARLMKKGGVGVQSTFHEEDIKDTVYSYIVMVSFINSMLLKGGVLDESSARLVKNRGPISAKITASGSHNRYCTDEGQSPGCDAQFSLIVWKFAGDDGTVHGTMSEKFSDGEVLKVDVDCMVRKNHEAIVGGVVTQIHKGGKQDLLNSRAFVKVSDNSNLNKVDRISDLTYGWGQDVSCESHDFDEFHQVDLFQMVEPRVSVCTKHGDWEGCLESAKME